MKLQFGILYRDSERVADRQDLETLLGEYASWDAETSGQHFDGPLLIAYRGDRITWEEDSETQPFSLGPYTITFDGRLDNRDDIAARIGIVANQNLPDPSLILQAYEKCGDSLLPDLIGEFALVIWHSDKRTLVFCRSVDGARPLFYLSDSKRLMWCSDIAHLVRISQTNPKLNNQYIWEYLLGTPSSELTPFATINAVGTGKGLHFAEDCVLSTTELWKPCSIQRLELRSDAEYEERLRHEIRDAVSARLRAKGTIFADLSGGLDSTSVTLTADAIIHQQNRDPRTLYTFSMIYDDSRSSDERYFITRVEAQRGVRSIYITEKEQAFSVPLTNIAFTGLPSVVHLYPGRYERYSEHMRTHNARVLLTGLGGDDIFCSPPYPEMIIADFLQQRHFIQAHQLCKSLSVLNTNSYAPLLLARAIPLWLSSLMPVCWQYELREPPAWLNLGRQEARRYAASMARHDTRLLPSQRARIGIAESMFRMMSIGLWSEYRDLYVSHPFSHRPLVEYCIAVPMTQMQRNGETRSLLRRAMAGLLPQKVAKRRGKAVISEPLSRAVQRDWETLGDTRTWRICSAGYVRSAELGDSLRELRMGMPHAEHRKQSVMMAVVMERFLRSLSLVRSSQFPADVAMATT